MRNSKDFQKLVVKMREKGFYLSKEKTAVDWAAYTNNQINDFVDSLKFIRSEVDKVHRPKKHVSVGRPPTDVGNWLKRSCLSRCLPLLNEKRKAG